jgi:hypothetical protein
MDEAATDIRSNCVVPRALSKLLVYDPGISADVDDPGTDHFNQQTSGMKLWRACVISIRKI